MPQQSDKDMELATQIIKRSLSGVWSGEPNENLREAMRYLLWWRGNWVIERYPEVLTTPSADEERVGPVYYEDQPLWLSKKHARFLLKC
jgi:hypothetical protein